MRARVAKITSRGREVTSNWMRNVFEAQSFVFYLTFGVLALIVLFGLVMVLSSSAVDSLRANNDAFYVFNRQLGFALAGFAALLFFSILPTAFFFRTGYYLFIGAVAAQLAVIFTPLGVSVNGNKAWLNLMFIKIQPSEFIKLGLILVLASFLHAREDEKFDPKRYSQRAFWIGFVALASIPQAGGRRRIAGDHQRLDALGYQILDLRQLVRNVVLGILQVGAVAAFLQHLDHVVAVIDPAG